MTSLRNIDQSPKIHAHLPKTNHQRKPSLALHVKTILTQRTAFSATTPHTLYLLRKKLEKVPHTPHLAKLVLRTLSGSIQENRPEIFQNIFHLLSIKRTMLPDFQSQPLVSKTDLYHLFRAIEGKNLPNFVQLFLNSYYASTLCDEDVFTFVLQLKTRLKDLDLTTIFDSKRVLCLPDHFQNTLHRAIQNTAQKKEDQFFSEALARQNRQKENHCFTGIFGLIAMGFASWTMYQYTQLFFEI
ncbi:MAG: hypothetical protein AAGI90_00910 [Chlamydiota bacterium]